MIPNPVRKTIPSSPYIVLYDTIRYTYIIRKKKDSIDEIEVFYAQFGFVQSVIV